MKIIISFTLLIIVNNLCFGQSGFWDNSITVKTTTLNDVGIGTANPDARLHIKILDDNFCDQNYSFLYQRFELEDNGEPISCNSKLWDILIENNGLSFTHTTKDYTTGNPLFTTNPIFLSDLGNVGINNKNPKAKLDVYGDIVIGKPDNNFLIHSRSFNGYDPSSQTYYGNGDMLMFTPWNSSNGTWDFSNALVLKKTGQVFIGAGISSGKHSNYKLAVDGKIVAKSLVITETNWADYVFSENYSLIGLKKLEEYINFNKHLPGLPNTETINENGVDILEMNIILLEKIEELTLYIIELNKKINKLNEESCQSFE